MAKIGLMSSIEMNLVPYTCLDPTSRRTEGRKPEATTTARAQQWDWKTGGGEEMPLTRAQTLESGNKNPN